MSSAVIGWRRGASSNFTQPALKLEIEVKIKKELKGDIVVVESPLNVGQAGSLQGRSAVFHPSSSHAHHCYFICSLARWLNSIHKRSEYLKNQLENLSDRRSTFLKMI
ncbi:hypothetical protein J6590_092092, partial [Homalodisca vitripennis]